MFGHRLMGWEPEMSVRKSLACVGQLTSLRSLVPVQLVGGVAGVAGARLLIQGHGLPGKWFGLLTAKHSERGSGNLRP